MWLWRICLFVHCSKQDSRVIIAVCDAIKKYFSLSLCIVLHRLKVESNNYQTRTKPGLNNDFTRTYEANPRPERQWELPFRSLCQDQVALLWSLIFSSFEWNRLLFHCCSLNSPFRETLPFSLFCCRSVSSNWAQRISLSSGRSSSARLAPASRSENDEW